MLKFIHGLAIAVIVGQPSLAQVWEVSGVEEGTPQAMVIGNGGVIGGIITVFCEEGSISSMSLVTAVEIPPLHPGIEKALGKPLFNVMAMIDSADQGIYEGSPELIHVGEGDLIIRDYVFSPQPADRSDEGRMINGEFLSRLKSGSTLILGAFHLNADAALDDPVSENSDISIVGSFSLSGSRRALDAAGC